MQTVAKRNIPLQYSPLILQAVRYYREGNSLRRLTIGSPAKHASKFISGTQQKLQKLRPYSMGKRRSSHLTPTSLRTAAKSTPLGMVSRIRQLSKFVNRLCYQFCR